MKMTKYDVDKEQEWLFTFGFGQPNQNTFVRIWGTFESAREEMFRRYGDKWAFQYPSSEEKELKRNFITELKV